MGIRISLDEFVEISYLCCNLIHALGYIDHCVDLREAVDYIDVKVTVIDYFVKSGMSGENSRSRRQFIDKVCQVHNIGIVSFVVNYRARY